MISQYGKTVQDYEQLQTASIRGTSEEIEKAVNQMGTSWEKAKENATQSLTEQINSQAKYVQNINESLAEAKKINDEYQEAIFQKQLETEEEQLKSLAKSLASQTATVKELTPEQVEAWRNISNQSLSAYNEATSLLPIETQNKIMQATGIIINNTTLQEASAEQGEKATTIFAQRFQMQQKAEEQINKSAETLKGDTTVQNEASKLANRAQSAVASNDSAKWGRDMVEGLGRGIETAGNSKGFTGKLKGLASKIASFIHFSKPDVGPLREYETWMPDMVKGLSRTLEKSSPELINSVKNMSNDVSNELKSINYDSTVPIKANQNSNSVNTQIDYNKMSNAMLRALTGCKFTLDEDGFAKIVKEELYKVV